MPLFPTMRQCLLRRLSIFASRCYREADPAQPSWAHPIPYLPNQSTAFLLFWEYNQVWCSPHAWFLTPTALAVQDLVAGPVLWPSRLPTSPLVEQQVAQQGLPMTQSPGSHAQGFFQKLHQGQAPCRGTTHKGAQVSEAPWEHLKQPAKEGLLKINSSCSSILHKEETRLQPWMSWQGQLCRVQKTVV